MNNEQMKRIAALAQKNAPKETSSITVRFIMVAMTIGGAIMGLAIIAKAAGL